MRFSFLSIISITLLFSCTKEIIQHKLSVSVTPINGGTVSPPSNSYEKGQSLQMLATPTGEYIFKEWKGDLTGTSNPTTLVIDKDKQVTGSFEKRQYPLNLTIEGSGTIKEEVIAVATQSQYPSGTTVRLISQPLQGWAFAGWSGDLTKQDSIIDIKIDKPITLKASFVERKIYFNLSVVKVKGGSISVESGQYLKGSKVQVTAIPDPNYHFLGIEGKIGIEKSFEIIIDGNKTIIPKFQIKHDGVKKRNNYFFNETELDFHASENFIVWWDKDFEYVKYSMVLLKELENLKSICKGFGWQDPYSRKITGLNGGNHLMSVYLYTNEEKSDIIWTSGKARCCGTGGNELEGMPYTGFYKQQFQENIDGSTYLEVGSKMLLYHEGFHMMQFSTPKTTNGNDVFPYASDSSWFTESSARWIERTFGIQNWNGDFYSKYNSLCTQYLQPQVSLWRHWNAKSWSHGMNGYEKGELFRFLIQEGYASNSFLFDMSYSKSSLLPQEYLFNFFKNFQEIYGQYASRFTSGIMYSDIEFEAAKNSIKWWLENSCKVNVNCDGKTGKPFNNQFVAEVNQLGTNGYVTPIEKNEAWSWSVVKIRTSLDQKFQIDFKPDQTGNERTLSNFTIYLANRENKLIQKVDFNGQITIKPNLDYYLVMVNTPQRFEGWETFDYKLKVSPIN